MTVKEAAALIGRPERTIRHWCEVHGIGRRIVGGAIAVSRVALTMLIEDDDEALRAYLAGDRQSELVRAYYERLGIRCDAAIAATATYAACPS
jgi:hypothetical protein